MHQYNQNDDNRTPHKPSVLSVWARDTLELPEICGESIIQNLPETSVEPVDVFIDQMLTYTRFHPSQASEWLLEDGIMFAEAGIYSEDTFGYVDIDDIVRLVDETMERW